MPDPSKNTYRISRGIEAIEVPDGYVVYLQHPDRAIFLNTTAAIVLEFCDGSNTVANIATEISSLFDLPTEPTTEVEGCIRSLLGEGLVENVSLESATGSIESAAEPMSFLKRLLRRSH